MSVSWNVSWQPIIYLVLVWAPWLICAVVVRIPRAGRTPAGHDARPLTVYEIAYLAGGVERTVTSVVAALVERGQLLIDRRARKLIPVGPRPVDALERTVADAAANEVGFYTILGIIKQARGSDPMRTLVAGLEHRGLVVPYRRVRTNRQIRKWLCLAVLVVGVAQWTVDFLSDRPVESLGFLLCGQAVMTILAWLSVKAPSQPPSPSGRRLLRTLKSQSTTPALRLTGAAGAVALGGFAMYPDAEVRSALMALSPSRSGSGGGDGGDGGE